MTADSGTCLRLLATRLASELCISLSLEVEGAGKAGCPHAPVGLRAKRFAQRREVHRYRRKHSGLPCTVVYGLLRALPGEPDFVVTVIGKSAARIPANLAPATGRQDHTALPSASLSFVSRQCLRPPHPALNVRDDAYAPHRGGTDASMSYF
jgi:hypothetical protein